MPRLDAILHPSIVDCMYILSIHFSLIKISTFPFKGSTLKELTLRWQPVRYTKRPHKQMMHRARDDIRESINELNHYRQQ
jgi:oligoribonuclease (3'-5' exoribonuclease)